MSTLSIGLLPLYLELYDQALPDARKPLEQFYNDIAAELRGLGLRVETSSLCRITPEFDAAVTRFEAAGVDALVTLHLAYSPSLESASALARTRLPIIVLDTTPTYAFGPRQSPDEIMGNHGIHGVQDMCNLLIRNRKPFLIEAGHWQKSDVLARVVSRVRAARMVTALRTARVGVIGGAFAGMGDFAVDPETIRTRLGPTLVNAGLDNFKPYVAAVTDAEISAEMEADRKAYRIAGSVEAAHRRQTVAGLAVRKWIEAEKLNAFTFNFMAFTRDGGLPTVPFLEASKAMGRGIGFAGEGDGLNAAFVHALSAWNPDTSFSEMFCPDWEGNRIFLSHMGEMNLKLVAGQPELQERAYSFIRAEATVAAVGCFRHGPALFVNLVPLVDNQFRLIAVPGVMEDAGHDHFTQSVRGWLRPHTPIETVLAEYSRLGGTHHAALVYADDWETLDGFATLMGWDFAVL